MSSNRRRKRTSGLTTAILWGIFAALLLLDCVLVGRLVFRAGKAAPEPETTPAVESTIPSEEPETLTADTPAPEEPDPSELRSQRAEELMGEMSLREKVCQMLIVTPEQLTGSTGPVTQAGEETKTALEAWPVGGVIYFADNIRTPEQVKGMIQSTQSYSGLGLFVSVDEEGGTVARVGNNPAMGSTSFPSMAKVAQEEGPAGAYQVGLTIGTELKELGFNLDFAPVADVNSNPANPVIGSRAFSSDPREAAELVSACVTGFRDSGILCALKHFPGHGDTAADSHNGAAVTSKTLEEMEECEFLPFVSGLEAGAPIVMVGHISCPELTGSNLPASLSQEMVTGILRQKLGFEGIVVTDSMQMAAVTDVYSSDAAAAAAVKAGVDIILMPDDLESAVNGILSAVENGELTEERIDESVKRILTVKMEQGILS